MDAGSEPAKESDRQSGMDLRRGVQLRGHIKLFTLQISLEKHDQSRFSRIRENHGIDLKRYSSSGEDLSLPNLELISER